MTGTSKTFIENKYADEIETFEGKKKIKTKPLYCKLGDELTVISESFYEHKDGKMFIVENKKGERFTIDENDINIEPEEDFFTNF